MCCLITALLLLGPRAAIFIWWLVDPVRWNLAFDSFVWPFLGFLFAPWTTLMYIAVAAGGLTGFDVVWVGLGVLMDLVSWTGGGYSNRNRLPTTMA